METQPVFDGDEITAPTLWIKHLVIKDSKLNNTNVRNSEKVHSCDQERQSALEEARQNPREGIVIPECAPGGLYKPVQCHQSTGYCWCVLVDTGRPLPGTSTRYVMPSCESDARAKIAEVDDPFKDRELPGCPEGKKMEFITSLLDALTTDMVQAINSAAPTGGGSRTPRLRSGKPKGRWRDQGGRTDHPTPNPHQLPRPGHIPCNISGAHRVCTFDNSHLRVFFLVSFLNASF